MSDISRVFNTAKETLLSNLTAINVTSSNIANVNTAGYSRLRPVFGAVRQAGAGVDSLQVGVRITNVERIYDRYLEEQLVQQQQEGRAKKQATTENGFQGDGKTAGHFQ